MANKISVFTIMMFITISAICQSTAKKPADKIYFSSINQVGLLTGGTGQSAAVQSINGIRMNKWFAGVGAGIDYYGTRGVPLFLDVRRELFSSKNSPFIYADGGIHLPWATNAQIVNKGYTSEAKSGAYFDGGVGVKLQTKKTGTLLLSAGFSYKKVKDKAQMYTIWMFPTPGPSFEYYNYYYRRIVVKVGIQF